MRIINSITSQPGGSVFVDDTANVTRIFNGRLSYSKGAYLLHMLRCKLGDNLFFQGLRNYQSDPSLIYSFARTTLLQQHLESVSGKNLSNFFTQWFFGQGYPTYLAIWNQDKNNQMKITLNQTTSHPSVAFYEMPVPVRFKGQGGDTTLIFDNNQISSSLDAYYALGGGDGINFWFRNKNYKFCFTEFESCGTLP